jgi:hypothetical protein
MRRHSVLVVCALAAAVAAEASGGIVKSTLSSDTIYDHDVGIINFRLWDTCHVEDTIWFYPGAENYGRAMESFAVIIGLYFEDSTLGYEQTVLVTGLSPGTFVWLYDSLYRTFTHPGTYIVFSCTAACAGDQNPANNGGKERVVVLPSQGLAEDKTGSVESRAVGVAAATFIDAAQLRSLVLGSKSRLRVLDFAGRMVSPDRPCKGVYFLVGEKPRKVVVR